MKSQTVRSLTALYLNDRFEEERADPGEEIIGDVARAVGASTLRHKPSILGVRRLRSLPLALG